ncbi:hypothetical protein EV714DRAFT_222555, partial [Schizophyllum commune]
NLPANDPSSTTHISKSTKFYEDVTVYLGDRLDDLALKPFMRKLKEYLLGRVRQHSESDRAYSARERNEIIFERGRIYKHKVIRHNYTSYDVRRRQDLLNPRTHADFMVLSDNDEEHPYWYGRVLGIFHADVLDVAVVGSCSQRIEFAYVRWFAMDKSYRHGFRAKRLPRVHFLPAEDADAFGFIDPKDIIRAVHAIPAFAHGRTAMHLPGQTMARPHGESDDWKYHYISMFADRDILMRFRGGGVGHKATLEATAALEAEAEKLANFRQSGIDAMSGGGEDSDGADEAASSDEDGCNEEDSGGSETEDNGLEDEDEDEDEDEEDEEAWVIEQGHEPEEEEDDDWEDDEDGEGDLLTADSLGYADW